MEVPIGNQDRLGLGGARQSATPPQATDQSSILPHSMLGKALKQEKLNSTLQPSVEQIKDTLQVHKSIAKEQHRREDYEAYWVGFRADQTTLSNTIRAAGLKRKIAKDSENRVELQSALPCVGGSVIEAKSSDYVKQKALQPIAWYTGLDGKPPIHRNEAPFQNVTKPQEKRRESASAIAGYLRRKALAVRAVTNKTKRRVIERVTKAGKPGGAQEITIPLSNRFGLVEDELSDEVNDETPDPEMGGVATSSVEGNEGSESKVVRRSKEPDQFIVDEELDFDELPLPSFKKARCLRDKKIRSVYTRLTYYLKCKHFMHSKDPHHIRTLVQDARAWLLKAKCSMETYQEYVLLTSAVSAAFFVDQEELNFRARMKNRIEWQALSKHNAACNGDLGWRLGQVEPRFNRLRHAFMTQVRLPNSPMSA